MKFFIATSLVFPRSLRLGIFLLCFATTQIPLVAYTLWGMTTGRSAASVFWLLLGAGLAAGTAAVAGIGALLAPIQRLADALEGRGEAGREHMPNAQDLLLKLYQGARRVGKAPRELDLGASEDVLTGILNRRGFLEKINALPTSARRGCFAVLDLDHFRKVNDEMGREEGDRVLCAMAVRLSEQTRRGDIVARWGGEEFIIFFNGVIESEACWALERIAWRMQGDPVGRIDGNPITFSGGVCRWVEDDLDGSLVHADEALFQAKRNGRDQVCAAVALTPATPAR